MSERESDRPYAAVRTKEVRRLRQQKFGTDFAWRLRKKTSESPKATEADHDAPCPTPPPPHLSHVAHPIAFSVEVVDIEIDSTGPHTEPLSDTTSVPDVDESPARPTATVRIVTPLVHSDTLARPRSARVLFPATQ
jgi:hypothetical protein